MKKRAGITALSTFYFIYFVSMGCSTFASKYFAEIGLTESHIGVLTSVPALIAMCFMPMWGALSDRINIKKRLLAFNVGAAGLAYLFVDMATDFTMVDPQTGALASAATKFIPLLLLLTANAIFAQSCIANATSLSIEYAASVGSTYGPIRMMGTVGYQVGALLIGFICADSLRHLYTWMGVVMLITAASALTMPNVAGHQHGREKVSPFVILKEKRIRTLMIMLLVACTTTMFYQSFFGAFMEKLNIGNQVASVITWVSVALEIPLLFFSAKIMKFRSIWQWVMIGFVITAVRWLGFALAARVNSWALLLVFQIPAVTVLACFEFFPSLYIGKIIAPELSSSAQNLLNLVSFGVAKFFGSLLGGFISQRIGMENMFLINGIMLLAAAAAFYPVCRRMHRADMAEQ